MKKPRGTKDLYGQEMAEFNYVCDSIKKFFSSFGYSEVKTPAFESVEVFAPNDEGFLTANKEFFYLENKKDSSKDPEFVLKPEMTAAVVRMVSEDKLLSEKNLKTLSYFYCDSCFRYERPQSGRFRQFHQAGVEKINANSIYDDVENIVLIKKIIDFFGLKNVKLKANYLGQEKTKMLWKNALTEYFKKYENELTEDSRKRLEVNPFRILDDKIDSKKEFVKNAPKIYDFLSSEEREKRGFLEIGISRALQDNNFFLSNDIFRGIDYYDGLVYEWVYSGIDEHGNSIETTIAAGGRYDGLFKRFDKKVSYPSLGFAIGIERFCMALKLEGKIPNFNEAKVYVCFEEIDYLKELPSKTRDLMFRKRMIEKSNFSCFINYEKMDLEKHLKIASRMNKNFFCWYGKLGKSNKKTFLFKNISTGKVYKFKWLWILSMYVYMLEYGRMRNVLLNFFK